MKDFFRKKGLREYLSLVCFLFSVLGLILYLAMGRNEFNKDISLLCVIPGFISVGLFLFAFSLPLPFVSEFAFFLSLFSFISYVGSQANYLANILTAIDGSSMSASFVFTILFFLLAFLISFVLLFLRKDRSKAEIRVISEPDEESNHE